MSENRFQPIARDPSCDFCNGSRQPPPIDVDAAYSISLVEESERTAYVTRHFHAIGLCRRAILYRPRRRVGNTHLGVWCSHRAVAVEALTRGQRRVLIMEDDVAFRRPIADLAPRIRRALAAMPAGWWGLYLGHAPMQAYFVARGLLRARSTCLHAYIANSPLLDWLATAKPMAAENRYWRMIGISIDSAVSLLPKMYAVFPLMALQKDFGEYRVDTRLSPVGKRRAWNDPERWRHYFIFRGALVAEAIAILASPFHWLTLELFLRRAEQGISRDAKAIREAGLFDDAYYLDANPDVAKAEVDPLLHYLQFGAAEGRWPNASFDPAYYAQQTALPRGSGNPLVHYIETGRLLGYRTHRDMAVSAAPISSSDA